MKKIVVGLIVSLFATGAFADTKVGLSLLKYDQSQEGDTLVDGEQTVTLYDLKIGHIFSNNIYAGFIYDSKTVDSGGADDKRTAYGATLGYHNKGWFVDLSYFLSAERDIGIGTLKDGSGLGLDFGYNAMMSKSFFMGVQMSYKSFTYKKLDDLSQDNKEKSELYPMFNIGVMF